MSEKNFPTYETITKFGEPKEEGKTQGPGIRWAIPEDVLPYFEQFKKAHKVAHGRIISRENILLKAVLYGLPALMAEMEQMQAYPEPAEEVTE